MGGGAIVAGQVAQVLGQVHAVGQRQGLRHGSARRGGISGGDGEGNLLRARRCRFLLALQAVETVGVLTQRDHGRVHRPGSVASLDLAKRQGQYRVGCTAHRQRIGSGLDGALVFLVAQFVLAQADQQHALGGHTGYLAQQQFRTGLA